MRTPLFYVYKGDADILSSSGAGNISMTVTDSEGLKADTLQIVFDDLDGMIEVPETGAILNPIGGYDGQLRDFGLFTVDSVSLEGWPQKMTVDAKSVAAKSLAKQREPKSYPPKDFPTYGDIYKSIAGTIGYSLQMASSLMGLPNPFEAQAEEDGLEFLERISEKINATTAVKSGNLVVVDKGAGQSASGQALPTIDVVAGFNLVSYAVTLKDEPKHAEVEATFYDRAKNERKTVTESTGMDGPKFLMRHPYQDEGEAHRAAQSKAKDLRRAQAEANFTIEGDPFAQAEAFAVASGIRQGVDGAWRVKTATHNFAADSPYLVTLQCDVPS